MSAVQQYLRAQISEALHKSLGLPVEFVEIRGDEMQITIPLNGPGSDSPFWAAVREAFND